MSAWRQTAKILNVDRGRPSRPINPLGQSSQSGQPESHDPSFRSGPCELRLGPPRSLPPNRTNFEAGSSSRSQSTHFTGSGSVCPVHAQLRIYLPMLDQTDPCELRLDLPGSPPSGPVNAEVSSDNDDLMIISPTAYQEAISSRTTRRIPVTDVESVESSQRNQRRRLDLDPQPSFVNFEGTSSSMFHVQHIAPLSSPPPPLPSPTPLSPSPPPPLPSPPLPLPSSTPPSPSPPPPLPSPPPPPPPPPPPTYDCPICLGPMVDEATATKCGHLFCDDCIRSAISVQAKCPMCRRRITSRGLLKIFLPSPV